MYAPRAVKWAALSCSLLWATVGLAQPLPRLYVGAQNGGLNVINAGTGAAVATVIASGTPMGIAVHPAQSTIFVTAHTGGTVSAVNTGSNTVAWSVATGSRPHGVAVSNTGTELIVANMGGNTASIIDVATRTAVATVPVQNAPAGVAVSPNAPIAYVANAGSASISVISLTSRTVVATWTTGSNPLGLAVSPDGSKLYVANNGNASLSVLNTANGLPLTSVRTGGHASGVAISPNGGLIVVTNSFSGSATIIRASDYVVLATVSVGSSPVGVAIASDSSAAFVVNSGSNSVSRIDLATNTATVAFAATSAMPANLGSFYVSALPCTLDVDRSGGAVSPMTDGILVLRYLFGLRGSALTAGAIGAAATLTPDEIVSNIAALNFDADGDAAARGTTDGLLILRLMLGLNGTALTTGASAVAGISDATVLSNVRAQHGASCFM